MKKKVLLVIYGLLTAGIIALYSAFIANKIAEEPPEWKSAPGVEWRFNHEKK